MSQSEFKIMVIDDNKEIITDFKKILKFNDPKSELDNLDKKLFKIDVKKSKIKLPKFVIDTANQGEEGFYKIRKAFQEGSPYALAFVDVRMPPGWDGIETIQRIWQVDPDIQAVICTAYSDYSWEETVELLGAKDNLLILKKPFDSTAVRQLAVALTKKWQLLQEKRLYCQLLEKKVQSRTNTLKQSLSLKRATLDSSADGMLVADSKGKVVDYNQRFLELWGLTKCMVEKKEVATVLNRVAALFEDEDFFMAEVVNISNKKDKAATRQYALKDGRFFEVFTQPYAADEIIVGRVWSFRDVTQQMRLQQDLEYQATHDTMTGLPNRFFFMDRLCEGIKRAKRNQFKIAVMYIDLDRFKRVNDSLTHEIGDQLLIDLATRIKKVVRLSDTFARVGGDEFALTVYDAMSKSDIILVANKLLQVVAEPFFYTNVQFNVAASIGISIYPDNATLASDMLRNADLAMYAAKENGGNCYKFYSEELNLRSYQRFKTESDLVLAMNRNEFFLVYQPQINIKTREVEVIEALARWRHPERGIVLPVDFIPVAESSGFIVPLGYWVLRQACLHQIQWQQHGLPAVRVSVNLATLQINQVDFVDRVKAILDETGMDPNYLELELTENVALSNSNIMHVVDELVALGVHFSFDDFGTGNSSLGYLHRMSVERLKIDKSFIKNLYKDKGDEVIVRAIISMAQGLDLKVVAEGVETEQQLQFLQQENCLDAQGYYFSEPMVASDMESFMRHKISPKAA